MVQCSENDQPDVAEGLPRLHMFGAAARVDAAAVGSSRAMLPPLLSGQLVSEQDKYLSHGLNWGYDRKSNKA